jgi:uncharacterized membrane protein YoaT (DUF817 family)
MNDFKRILINTVLALVNLIVVSLFWRNQPLLVVLLAVLSLLMLTVLNDRKSIIVYIISFLVAPLAESVAISQGTWTYAGSTISGIGIPIWLPFLWANAALFIITTEKLSNIFFSKNNKKSKHNRK